MPIEQKESFRWLENLRQSTALFDDPARCIHIGDPPPGNTVIWRGLSRLADITLGATLRPQLVGN